MSDLLAIICMILVVLAMLLGAYFVAGYRCHAQWDRSGMPADFALFQGCMLTLKDGTHIPADAYREIP